MSITNTEEKEIWERLLSCRRLDDIKQGKKSATCEDDPRNPFQRDCDRITYSYPFRRLQDKTQVIPLPVTDFVHTRLTHSLEVTTVGRSLGKLLENELVRRQVVKSSNIGSIPSVVAAACLSHDIGNPPFGHSGEDSISEFFKQNDEGRNIYPVYEGNWDSTGYKVIDVPNECKLRDLTGFEGNAMGFRLLTHRDQFSLNLTCATLAAFTKYPRQSFLLGEEVFGKRWNEDRVSQKKYGFFQTELENFKIVAKETGLKELKISGGEFAWARHPLAFLMEAADDICYRIIDLEDGFRIERIPFKEAEEPLKAIASLSNRFDFSYHESLKQKNKFSYIRALAIDQLIHETFNVFTSNYEGIINGSFDKDLLKGITNKMITDALVEIKEVVKRYIYKWPNVLSIEAAGFEVLGQLLSEYIQASNTCLSCPPETRSKRAEKILDLLPEEYRHLDDEEELYLRYLKIASYVSGMTDTFAYNIFQRMKGILK